MKTITCDRCGKDTKGIIYQDLPSVWDLCFDCHIILDEATKAIQAKYREEIDAMIARFIQGKDV